MKMKVILDTNIFVSGIFWEGNYCSQIIDAWRAGKIILVSSLEIIQELVGILKNFKIEMPEEMIKKWQNMIIENSIIVMPSKKLDLVKDDPDDNKFFEAALAANVDYIISQDKHLLRVGEYDGVKVVKPKEFLNLLFS